MVVCEYDLLPAEGGFRGRGALFCGDKGRRCIDAVGYAAHDPVATSCAAARPDEDTELGFALRPMSSEAGRLGVTRQPSCRPSRGWGPRFSAAWNPAQSSAIPWRCGAGPLELAGSSSPPGVVRPGASLPRVRTCRSIV